MTQEEKKLLLKDLCARLPYEPHIYIKAGKAHADIVLNGTHIHDWMTVPSCQNITIKPYLRPMSTMTGEERKYYIHLLNLTKSDRIVISKDGLGTSGAEDIIDYLNAHYLDFRGLIPMGLALEAPKDMYKTE